MVDGLFRRHRGKHSSHWCLDELGDITSNGELTTTTTLMELFQLLSVRHADLTETFVCNVSICNSRINTCYLLML